MKTPDLLFCLTDAEIIERAHRIASESPNTEARRLFLASHGARHPDEELRMVRAVAVVKEHMEAPAPPFYRATIQGTTEPETKFSADRPTLAAALLAVALDLQAACGDVAAEVFEAMHAIRENEEQGEPLVFKWEDFSQPENNFIFSAEAIFPE